MADSRDWQLCAKGLNRSRGNWRSGPRLRVVDRSALLLMLRSEAIRLIFRQEQHHELNDTNYQPVAPTLS